jgi:peptide/nickel transport system substrate-binding protein/oligopeptide transport system substrate-binding protein
MVDPAKKAEREAKWGSIFTKLMEDAPWAPVFNEQRFTMHSPRMQGDPALYVDPVHIPVNYDYVYVNDAQ